MNLFEFNLALPITDPTWVFFSGANYHSLCSDDSWGAFIYLILSV